MLRPWLLLLLWGAVGADIVVPNPQQVIMVPFLDPPLDQQSLTWVAALRLRMGDIVYISNRVQYAAVNLNLYRFGANNLYYYQASTGLTLFLTYLIPGHSPQGLFWAYTRMAEGTAADADSVLVTTATCVLRLWVKAANFFQEPLLTIEAGHCYEAPQFREGPLRFARFNQIQALAHACAPDHSCAMLLLDTGQRLCMLEGGLVSCIFVLQRVQALSMVAGWTVALAWALPVGGLSRFVWGAPVGAVGLHAQVSFVALLLLPQPPYLDVFAVEASSRQMYRLSWPTLQMLGLGVLPLGLPQQQQQLCLDYPYGIYVPYLANMSFYLMRNLGCRCPPGYTIMQIETVGHCQPSPAGGYVDLLGRFVVCPAGTYAPQPMATVAEACVQCPPFTFSAENQSVLCELCMGTPSPTSAYCLTTGCPNGTLMQPGQCAACPEGQTAVGAACVACPLGSYSDPAEGLYTCAACEEDSQSSFCPQPCTALPSSLELVSSINVLGGHPVDLAVAQNGTLYVATYQSLVIVGQNGGSSMVFLPEFALVRGIALGQGEAVLYAAIMQGRLLCLAMGGTVQWYAALPPLTVGVGVRLWQGQLVVWDAQNNAVMGAARGSVLFQGDSQNGIVALNAAGDMLWVMLQNGQQGNQSVVSAVDGRVWARNTEPSTAWNPYLVVWRGQLVLSSGNAIVGLAGLANATGRVDGPPSTARFTSPGPMVVAPRKDEDMLVVADQTGLRLLLWNPVCRCDAGTYQGEAGCLLCPAGLYSMAESRTCTPCGEGQYNDAVSGNCVPCARSMWWEDGLRPCPRLVDTMVSVDASGVSLSDITSELLLQPQQELLVMAGCDYVSQQTLVLPIAYDAVLQDAAANSRFWMRMPRVTPPPHVYVDDVELYLDMPLVLPGFWVQCSKSVLQFEPCTCDLGVSCLGGGRCSSGTQRAQPQRPSTMPRCTSRSPPIQTSTCQARVLRRPSTLNPFWSLPTRSLCRARTLEGARTTTTPA